MFSFVLHRTARKRGPFNALLSASFLSISRRLPAQLPVPTFLPRGTKQDEERIALLEAKIEKARKRRSASTYRPTADSAGRVRDDGKLRCNSCGAFKTADSFRIDQRYKYGLKSHCKACDRESAIYYTGFTLRGTMVRFLYNAKGSAAKRSKMPSREKAGDFDLTLNYLLNLWDKQKGRCEYSDIVMNVELYTHWRISLERRDNTLGYVPGNVAFICAEFNTSDRSLSAKSLSVLGSSTWSKEKVQSLPRTIDSSFPLDEEDLYITILPQTYRAKRRRSPSTREITPTGDLSCISCQQFKPLKDFNADRKSSVKKQSWCRSCQFAHTTSFFGFFITRLFSAKRGAKVRTAKGRVIAGEFDLTIDYILNLYRHQKGLCFYSGARLSLQPRSDWLCSIERLDNKRGYVDGNVALICGEFQSGDSSYKAKLPVKGTAQWSKEKVAMLLQYLGRNQQASRAA
eukprot:GEMP01043018.1.p1 GENE.GEMP01043018.1~~GEMP01043018.1.p1  ORF type:complete len:458 (+),score=30.25 GEMP01043018.1:139-1512(+)